MRIKKVLSLLMAAVLSISMLSIPAFAGSPDIMPYNNNTVSTTTTFTVSSTGMATMKAEFTGIQNVTSKALITMRIQILRAGKVWLPIADGYWEQTINSYRGSMTRTKQLPEKGTYRVAVLYTVSGSGGPDDTIWDYPQRVY